MVLIHDISRTGLLIESSSPLPLHGHFEVELPLAGKIEAEVIWTSGAFFGCHFRKQISQATLSATLLRAEPQTAESAGSADLTRAAAELSELSWRVQQLRFTVEQVIERLSREPVERPQSAEVPAYEEQAEETSEEEDGRLTFANRARIILALALGSWALILLVLWAAL